jgi:hypothetical protein
VSFTKRTKEGAVPSVLDLKTVKADDDREIILSGGKVRTREFYEGSDGPGDKGGRVPISVSIVKVEVIELRPTGPLKKEGREPGWQISVDPWLAPVHKYTGKKRKNQKKEREALLWISEYPIAIRFQEFGHFYETHPFSLGSRIMKELEDNEDLDKRFGFYACSGPVKPAVPVRLGPFKYTIDIFPKSNVVLTIDPEYVVEQDGLAP